ncbi:hypothetical protein, partial [Sphingobacterium yanglingense]|uniref:hypothetical protein n=1 Tax=Sphingobacterium yanglingense TaxID=1437280 RepID=UPI001B87B80F
RRSPFVSVGTAKVGIFFKPPNFILKYFRRRLREDKIYRIKPKKILFLPYVIVLKNRPSLAEWCKDRDFKTTFQRHITNYFIE